MPNRSVSNTTPSTAESCSFAKPMVKLHRDAVQREAVGEMQDPSVDSPGMMTITRWDTKAEPPTGGQLLLGGAAPPPTPN